MNLNPEFSTLLALRLSDGKRLWWRDREATHNNGLCVLGDTVYHFGTVGTGSGLTPAPAGEIGRAYSRVGTEADRFTVSSSYSGTSYAVSDGTNVGAVIWNGSPGDYNGAVLYAGGSSGSASNWSADEIRSVNRNEFYISSHSGGIAYDVMAAKLTGNPAAPRPKAVGLTRIYGSGLRVTPAAWPSPTSGSWWPDTGMGFCEYRGSEYLEIVNKKSASGSQWATAYRRIAVSDLSVIEVTTAAYNTGAPADPSGSGGAGRLYADNAASKLSVSGDIVAVASTTGWIGRMLPFGSFVAGKLFSSTGGIGWRWRHNTGDQVWRMVATDDSVYYASGDDGWGGEFSPSQSYPANITAVAKLDATYSGAGTGSDPNELWKNTTFKTGTFTAHSLRVSGDYVILCGREVVSGVGYSRVILFDSATGNVIWSKTPQSGDTTANDAIIHGDRVYVSCASRAPAAA